ncbi:MAG: 50S ribosomal protein L10 [Candidatus Omnitrophica bacterium]|nr:50S ribosomal protein L10 [Candidatus Omnitrophota bacterium]
MARVGRMVKEAGVEELSTALSSRPNFFVAGVNRLPASDADAFRKQLSGSQARLVVVKRRLGRRAVERLKIDGLANLFEGSVGIVLAGDDALLAAKLLVEFRKAHEERLSVRGGVIDGQLLDPARVEELAQLPPKPVLLAQVVLTLESPLADVIFTLERLIGDIAWLAEQAAAAKPLPAANDAGQAGAAPQAGAEAKPADTAQAPPPDTSTTQEGPSS